MRTRHKRMFGEVWRWAGIFRITERNIGIHAYRRVGVELARPLDDIRYGVEHETCPPDYIAIRFHHRPLRSTRFRTEMAAKRATSLLVGL